MPQRKPALALTTREQEILVLLADGYTNEQVAEKLSLSVHTINAHRTRINLKLDFNDIPALIKYAVKNGLTNVEPS